MGSEMQSGVRCYGSVIQWTAWCNKQCGAIDSEMQWAVRCNVLREMQQARQ